MARYDQGNLNEAIIDCNKAIEINPALAVAYASRGAAKLRLGEDGEAQEDFEKARHLDENMVAGLEEWIKDIKRGQKTGWAERLFHRVTNSRRLTS